MASSKKVSQKGELPLIRRIGFTVTPGWCMVISTKLMPSCLGTSGSVRTRAKIQSATWAPEVQIFWPLMTKWSPLSTARVRRLARSEPELGSL